MFNSSDIQTLRSQGRTNHEILEMMAPVVPSARKALDMINADTKTPEWQRETKIGQMLDKGVPKNAPSGFPYMTAIGLNQAQKAFDEKKATPELVQQEDLDDTQKEPEKKSGGVLGYLGETLSNVPKDAMNVAGDVYQAARHPLKTIEGVARLVEGTGENIYTGLTGKSVPQYQPDGTVLRQEGPSENAQMASNLVDSVVNAVSNPLETFKNNPVSTLMTVAPALQGIGKLSRISSLEKVGKAINPVTQAAKIIKPVGKAAAGVGKYATSQATGLNPETMSFIINHSDDFTAAQKGGITRASVAEKVQKGTQSVLDDLSDTGKAYEGVRKGAGDVTIPGGSIGKLLSKKGFKVDTVDDGLKVKLSTDIDTSIPITKAELGELEDFVNLVNGKEKFTPAQFLNVRNKLTQMSKFDAVKSDAFRGFAKKMRQEWNALGRGQVKGLRALDDQYGPLVEEASKLRKDFIEVGTDGSAILKENAISKIANLTKKGNEAKLARIQKLIPEIADEVNAIKALEDVQYANGIKIGTYFRGGFAATGLATGNIPMIIGSILSSPSVAVPVLKFYGKMKHLSPAIIDGIGNRISKGLKLSDEQGAIMSAALDHADDLNYSQVQRMLKAGQKGGAKVFSKD